MLICKKLKVHKFISLISIAHHLPKLTLVNNKPKHQFLLKKKLGKQMSYEKRSSLASSKRRKMHLLTFFPSKGPSLFQVIRANLIFGNITRHQNANFCSKQGLEKQMSSEKRCSLAPSKYKRGEMHWVDVFFI